MKCAPSDLSEGSLNLDTMQQRLISCLGARSSFFDGDTLNQALNVVYQRQMPNRIQGTLRNIMVTVNMQADKDEYTFAEIEADQGIDTPLRTVRAGATYEGSRSGPLRFYTRPEYFWGAKLLQSNPKTGRPHSYLAGYDRVTFYPMPGGDHSVLMPFTAYRAPLTLEGLEDDEEATAVVHGAAVYLAAQFNLDDLIPKNNAFYDGYMNAVRKRSMEPRRDRARRRDF